MKVPQNSNKRKQKTHPKKEKTHVTAFLKSIFCCSYSQRKTSQCKLEANESKDVYSLSLKQNVETGTEKSSFHETTKELCDLVDAVNSTEVVKVQTKTRSLKYSLLQIKKVIVLVILKRNRRFICVNIVYRGSTNIIKCVCFIRLVKNKNFAFKEILNLKRKHTEKCFMDQFSQFNYLVYPVKIGDSHRKVFMEEMAITRCFYVNNQDNTRLEKTSFEYTNKKAKFYKNQCKFMQEFYLSKQNSVKRIVDEKIKRRQSKEQKSMSNLYTSYKRNSTIKPSFNKDDNKFKNSQNWSNSKRKLEFSLLCRQPINHDCLQSDDHLEYLEDLSADLNKLSSTTKENCRYYCNDLLNYNLHSKFHPELLDDNDKKTKRRSKASERNLPETILKIPSDSDIKESHGFQDRTCISTINFLNTKPFTTVQAAVKIFNTDAGFHPKIRKSQKFMNVPSQYTQQKSLSRQSASSCNLHCDSSTIFYGGGSHFIGTSRWDYPPHYKDTCCGMGTIFSNLRNHIKELVNFEMNETTFNALFNDFNGNKLLKPEYFDQSKHSDIITETDNKRVFLDLKLNKSSKKPPTHFDKATLCSNIRFLRENAPFFKNQNTVNTCKIFNASLNSIHTIPEVIEKYDPTYTLDICFKKALPSFQLSHSNLNKIMSETLAIIQYENKNILNIINYDSGSVLPEELQDPLNNFVYDRAEEQSRKKVPKQERLRYVLHSRLRPSNSASSELKVFDDSQLEMQHRPVYSSEDPLPILREINLLEMAVVDEEHRTEASPENEDTESPIETTGETLPADTSPDVVAYKDKLQYVNDRRDVQYEIMLHPQQKSTATETKDKKATSDLILESASEEIVKNIIPARSDDAKQKSPIFPKGQTKQLNQPPTVWKTGHSTDQIDKLLESLLTKEKKQINDQDILEILKKSSNVSLYTGRARSKEKAGYITIYRPSESCRKRCRLECKCSAKASRACHPKTESPELDEKKIITTEIPRSTEKMSNSGLVEDGNLTKMENRALDGSHLNRSEAPLRILLLDDAILSKNRLSEYHYSKSKVKRDLASQPVQFKAKTNHDLSKQDIKEQTIEETDLSHSDASLENDNEEIIKEEVIQPRKGTDGSCFTKCTNLPKQGIKEKKLKLFDNCSEVSFASRLPSTKEDIKIASDISLEILLPDLESGSVTRIDPNEEVRDLSSNTSEDLKQRNDEPNIQDNIDEEYRTDKKEEIIKHKLECPSMKTFESHIHGRRGSSRRISSQGKRQIDAMFLPEIKLIRKGKTITRRPITIKQKLDKATTWPRDMQVDRGSQTSGILVEKSVGNVESMDEKQAYIEQINSFLEVLIGSKGSLKENQEFPKDLKISIDTASGNKLTPEGDDETNKSEAILQVEKQPVEIIGMKEEKGEESGSAVKLSKTTKLGGTLKDACLTDVHSRLKELDSLLEIFEDNDPSTDDDLSQYLELLGTSSKEELSTLSGSTYKDEESAVFKMNSKLKGRSIEEGPAHLDLIFSEDQRSFCSKVDSLLEVLLTDDEKVENKNSEHVEIYKDKVDFKQPDEYISNRVSGHPIQKATSIMDNRRENSIYDINANTESTGFEMEEPIVTDKKKILELSICKRYITILEDEKPEIKSSYKEVIREASSTTKIEKSNEEELFVGEVHETDSNLVSQTQEEESELSLDKNHERAKIALESQTPSSGVQPFLYKEITTETREPERQTESLDETYETQAGDTYFKNIIEELHTDDISEGKESEEEINLCEDRIINLKTFETKMLEKKPKPFLDETYKQKLGAIKSPQKTKLLSTETNKFGAETTESKKPLSDEIYRAKKPKTVSEIAESRNFQKGQDTSLDETYKSEKSRNDLPPIIEHDSFTEEVKKETSIIAKEPSSKFIRVPPGILVHTTHQEDFNKNKGTQQYARRSKEEKTIVQQLEDPKLQNLNTSKSRENRVIDLSQDKSSKGRSRKSKEESSKINVKSVDESKSKDLNTTKGGRKSLEGKGVTTDAKAQKTSKPNQTLLPNFRIKERNQTSAIKVYTAEDTKSDKFMKVLDEPRVSILKHKQVSTTYNSALENKQSSPRNSTIGTNEKSESKFRSSFWKPFRNDEKKAKRYSLKSLNEQIKSKFQKRNSKLNQCHTKDKASSLPELHYKIIRNFDSYRDTLSEKEKNPTKFQQMFLRNKKIPSRDASRTETRNLSRLSMRSVRVGTDNTTRQKTSNISRNCKSVRIVAGNEISNDIPRLPTRICRGKEEKGTSVRCVRSIAVGTLSEFPKREFKSPKYTIETSPMRQEQVEQPEMRMVTRQDYLISKPKDIAGALADIKLLHVLCKENRDTSKSKGMQAVTFSDMTTKRLRHTKLQNQIDRSFSNDSLQSNKTPLSASTVKIEEGGLVKQYKISKGVKNVVPFKDISMSFDVSLINITFSKQTHQPAEYNIGTENSNFLHNSTEVLGVAGTDKNDLCSSKTSEKMIGFFNIHNTPPGSTTTHSRELDANNSIQKTENHNSPVFSNGSTLSLILKPSSFIEELKPSTSKLKEGNIPSRNVTLSTEELLIKKDSYDMSVNNTEEELRQMEEDKHPAECLYINKSKANPSETNATFQMNPSETDATSHKHPAECLYINKSRRNYSSDTNATFQESSSSYEDIDLTKSKTTTKSSKLTKEESTEMPTNVSKTSECVSTCDHQKKICKCRTLQQQRTMCLCKIAKAKQRQVQYPFKDSYLFNNRNVPPKSKVKQKDGLSSRGTSTCFKYFPRIEPPKEREVKMDKQVAKDDFDTQSETSSSKSWTSYVEPEKENSYSERQHRSIDSEEKRKELSSSIIQTLSELMDKNRKQEASRSKKNKTPPHSIFNPEEIASLLEFLIDKKKELTELPELASSVSYTNIYPEEYFEDLDKSYQKRKNHLHHHHHHHKKSRRKHKKKKPRTYYTAIDMKEMAMQKTGKRKFGLSTLFPSKQKAYVKNITYFKEARDIDYCCEEDAGPTMDRRVTFDKDDNMETQQTTRISPYYPSKQHASNSVPQTDSIKSNFTANMNRESSQNNYLDRDKRTPSFIILPKSQPSDSKQNARIKPSNFESTSSLRSKDSVQSKKRLSRDTSYLETPPSPLRLDSATQTAITTSVSKTGREASDSISLRTPKGILSTETPKQYRSRFKNSFSQTLQRDTNRTNIHKNNLDSDISSLSGDSSMYLHTNTSDLTFDKIYKIVHSPPGSESRPTQTSVRYSSLTGLPISIRTDSNATISTSRLKATFGDLMKGTQTFQPLTENSNFSTQTDLINIDRGSIKSVGSQKTIESDLREDDLVNIDRASIKSVRSQKDTRTIESDLKKDDLVNIDRASIKSVRSQKDTRTIESDLKKDGLVNIDRASIKSVRSQKDTRTIESDLKKDGLVNIDRASIKSVESRKDTRDNLVNIDRASIKSLGSRKDTRTIKSDLKNDDLVNIDRASIKSVGSRKDTRTIKSDLKNDELINIDRAFIKSDESRKDTQTIESDLKKDDEAQADLKKPNSQKCIQTSVFEKLLCGAPVQKYFKKPNWQECKQTPIFEKLSSYGAPVYSKLQEISTACERVHPKEEEPASLDIEKHLIRSSQSEIENKQTKLKKGVKNEDRYLRHVKNTEKKRMKNLSEYTSPVIVYKEEQQNHLLDELAVIVVEQSPKSQKKDLRPNISISLKLDKKSSERRPVQENISRPFTKQDENVKKEAAVVSSRHAKPSTVGSSKTSFTTFVSHQGLSGIKPKIPKSSESLVTVEILKHSPYQEMSSEYFEPEPSSRLKEEKRHKIPSNQKNKRHSSKTSNKRSKVEARYLTSIFPKQKDKIKGVLVYEINVGRKKKTLVLIPDLNIQASSAEQSNASSQRFKTEEHFENENVLQLLAPEEKDIPIGISALKEYSDKPLILNKDRKLFNFAKGIQTCLKSNNSACAEDSDNSTFDGNQLRNFMVLKGTPNKKLLEVPIPTYNKMEEDNTSTSTSMMEKRNGKREILVMPDLDKNAQIFLYDEASLAEVSDISSYVDTGSLNNVKLSLEDGLPKLTTEVEDVKMKNKNKMPMKKEQQNHGFGEKKQSTQTALYPNSSSSSSLSFMINPKNDRLDHEKYVYVKPKLLKGYFVEDQKDLLKGRIKSVKTPKEMSGISTGIKVTRNDSKLWSFANLYKNTQILSFNEQEGNLLKSSRRPRVNQQHHLVEPKKLIKLDNNSTSGASINPAVKYQKAHTDQVVNSKTDNRKIFDPGESERSTQTAPRKRSSNRKTFHNVLYLTVEESEHSSSRSQEMPKTTQKHNSTNQTDKRKKLDSENFKKLEEKFLSANCYKTVSQQFQTASQNKGQDVKAMQFANKHLCVTSNCHEKPITIKDNASNMENKVYRLIVPRPKSTQDYRAKLDEPRRKQKSPRLFNIDKTLTILPVGVDTKFYGISPKVSLNRFLDYCQPKHKNTKKLKVDTFTHQDLIREECETNLRKSKVNKTLRKKIVSKQRSLEKRKPTGNEVVRYKKQKRRRSVSLKRQSSKENKTNESCTKQKYRQLQVLDQGKCMPLLSRDRLLMQVLKVISRQFERFRHARSEPFFRIFKCNTDEMTSSSLLLQALNSSNRSESILRTSKALLKLAASSMSTIMGIPSISSVNFAGQEYPLLLFPQLKPPSPETNSLAITPLSSNHNTQNAFASIEEITDYEQNMQTKNQILSYFLLMPNSHHKHKRSKNATFACHLGRGDTMSKHNDNDLNPIYNTKVKTTNGGKTMKKECLSRINLSDYAAILNITFENISIQTVSTEDEECQTILCARYKRIRNLINEDRSTNTINHQVSSTTSTSNLDKVAKLLKRPNLSKIDDMKAAEYPIIVLPKHIQDRLDLKPRLRKLINLENLKTDKILLLQSESLSEQRKLNSNTTVSNSAASYNEKVKKAHVDNRKCETNTNKYRTVYKKLHYEREIPRAKGSTSLDSTSKSSLSFCIRGTEESDDHTDASSKHFSTRKGVCKDSSSHDSKTLKSYFTNQAYLDTSKNLFQTSGNEIRPALQTNKRYDKPQQTDRNQPFVANTTDVILLKNTNFRNYNSETMANDSSTSSVSTTNTEILNVCNHKIFCHNMNRVKHQEPPKKPEIWQIFCNKRYLNQNASNVHWQNSHLVQYHNSTIFPEYAIPEKETLSTDNTLMSKYLKRGKDRDNVMQCEQNANRYPPHLQSLLEYKILQKLLNARQQLPHQKSH